MTSEIVRPDLDFALHDLVNLHDILEDLRTQHGAVVKVNFVGRPVWLINSYQDVLHALSDEEHLSTPEAYKRSIGKSMGTVMATMTGRQHRLNRAVVAGVFFPKKMRALSETVFRDEANKLVDVIRNRLTAGESLDLMQVYTRTLTFNIITRLLGLPVADQSRLLAWGDAIMASWDLDNALKARDELTAYLEPILAERLAHPGEDFLSMLVMARVSNEDTGEEEGLSQEEIFSFIRNLFPAGIDTSSKSMGSLIAVVLNDAVLQEQALQGGEPLEAIVNELLRWQPPLAMVPRRCVKAITLGGQTLKPGENVMLGIAGGNSDARAFPEPRRFDPSRKAKILSFGHGEHYCIGTHMARRVLETGLVCLLEGIPGLALVKPEVEFVHGVLRGPRDLWVRLRV